MRGKMDVWVSSGDVGSRAGRAVTVALALLVAGACSDVTEPGPAEPPTITTDSLAAGAVGVGYADGLTASGGLAPYTWDVPTGSLPFGVVLDYFSGTLFGTPITEGTSTFTVRVTGDDGLSATKSLAITVGPEPLRVLTTPLPDAIVGEDYLMPLRGGGGDSVYVWSLASGSLPPGLSLVDSVISGRPTGAGYFTIGIQVESDGETATAHDRIRVYPTTGLRELLRPLQDVISVFLRQNEEQLPRNPHLASELQAKIDLLSDSALEASILNGAFFEEAWTTTLDGRSIPVTVIFPADTMREGARLDRERVLPTLATLEAFLGVPWPHAGVEEWYGFSIGHSGGGGELRMEDRGTYANRGAPHDVIVPHELGHSYIGHEGLTQFLEVYGFNVVETGSTDLSDWTWLRQIGSDPYVPFAPGNDGAWALMDIYQLVGPEAMGAAYARVRQLGAPYGTPLSSAGRQAFVDEAPIDVRDQVADLVPRI
jgi:hypothetical protein